MDGASFFKELVTMWVLTVGVTGPAQPMFVSTHLECVVCLMCLSLAGLCVCLAATSLAAPRHPLHPPSPEPGIAVAFTREFLVFICFWFVFHHFSPGLFHSVPFCFHSVPVSYLAASPMAPPGRLWLSHLLPAKKAQGQKTETALRDFCNVLQCSTMFCNVLQCYTCFIMFLHLQYLSILHHPIAEVY